MKKHLLATALIALCAAPALAQNFPGIGQPAPDFTATDRQTGEAVNFHSLEGRVLVLDFFAYWCPPCVFSSPDVRANIHEHYAALGGNAHGVPVEVLFINVEPQNPSATNQFIANHGLERVWDDFHRNGWRLFNERNGIPLFAVVNGVTGSASHGDWEILHADAGYPGANYLRSLIDRVEPAATGPTNPWVHATELGQGWQSLEWFGAFHDTGASWIYHAEHGWWFILGESTQNLFIYDTALGAWAWTADTVYPSIYWFAPLHDWTFYSSGGQPGNRWFQHLATGEWRLEGQLFGE